MHHNAFLLSHTHYPSEFEPLFIRLIKTWAHMFYGKSNTDKHLAKRSEIPGGSLATKPAAPSVDLGQKPVEASPKASGFT